METLAEKNKSLFAQLRELKARIGSIGGGRKSSNATLSMLVLWFGIGLSSDVWYWSSKLEHLGNTAAAAAAAAGPGTAAADRHFQSRTLQTVDQAYNDSIHAVNDALQVYSATSFPSLPFHSEYGIGLSTVTFSFLTTHERCILTQGTMETELDLVSTVLFYVVLVKLACMYRRTNAESLYAWPKSRVAATFWSVLCFSMVIDVNYFVSTLKFWLLSECTIEL